MLNSILFSSDMKTLYLIDDGRAIEFPLTEKGVLIGMLGDQLSVVSSVKIPVPVEDKPDDATSGSGSGEEDTPAKAKAASIKIPAPLPSDLVFPVRLKVTTEKSQWTLSFNEENKVLLAIGATDIELLRPDKPLVNRLHLFRLDRGILRITKTGSVLDFQYLQKLI